MKQKYKILVKSTEDKGSVVEIEGREETLKLSDRVKEFYKDGLIVGETYEIDYDKESKTITYIVYDKERDKRAKFEDVLNSKTKNEEFKPLNTKEVYNKDIDIKKQVALKCASYHESDINKIKSKAKELFIFLNTEW